MIWVFFPNVLAISFDSFFCYCTGSYYSQFLYYLFLTFIIHDPDCETTLKIYISVIYMVLIFSIQICIKAYV
jgi:hypothetical protein